MLFNSALIVVHQEQRVWASTDGLKLDSQMTIPLEMAPKGMRLPPGVALVYDVTLNEVFDNYLN